MEALYYELTVYAMTFLLALVIVLPPPRQHSPPMRRHSPPP